MNLIKKITYLLDPHEFKLAILLLLMIILMGFIEVLGIASILPFISVLTNPEIIHSNFILKKMYYHSRIIGVDTDQEFIFILGVIVFFILIFSIIFKALTAYVQTRFIQMREYSISKRLIEGYLHQPYIWFLNRNSVDLGKNILTEVNGIVSHALFPLFELISKSIIAICIIFLLVLVNPTLALIVGCLIGGTYTIVFYFARNYLRRIGHERLKNNKLRFLTVSDAFGAIKEIKVGSLEKVYIKLFSDPARKFALNKTFASIISFLPRYALEITAFGGILLLILNLIKETGNLNNSLPIISLYIFAGYRLMPALSQIYSSFTQFTFQTPTIDKIYKDLKNFKEIKEIKVEQRNNDRMSFNKNISLKNIYFNYPNSSVTALNNINLNIPSKSIIGIIGETGSGKTTLVNIILGLLEPEKGHLEVDDKIITKENIRSWQQSIGYVPQNIYLTDNTISANIAFGVDQKYINHDSVEKASRIANLHEFIINDLPYQYNTKIGERGARLSGGQRQRIGIARALYYNPKLIILDEATSSLDYQTEKMVMDAVNNLSNNISTIIIAHRLNTLNKCNKIFVMKNGKLQKEVKFEELIKANIDLEKSYIK